MFTDSDLDFLHSHAFAYARERQAVDVETASQYADFYIEEFCEDKDAWEHIPKHVDAWEVFK